MIKSSYLNISPDLKQLISSKQAWHYRIVPKEEVNDKLELYIDTSKNINGVKHEIEVILGREVVLNDLEREDILSVLNSIYPKSDIGKEPQSLPKMLANKENFIMSLVEEARNVGSSDIHFEIREKGGVVRYRIDGHLQSRYEIPKSDYPAVVNAVKIKASLDIAEKRLPQDGRIQYNKGGTKMDIRVSIVPVNQGEKIVFRLLNKDSKHIDLSNIGLDARQLKMYESGFLRSHGIILVSGPTGSGKTTTLYATLQRLNQESKNILTIEDPVEYTMEGVNQVQLKENIGLTFPLALKTFLRQDPDIIMVGEIRDAETAQIAIRAALTGHLVLSTIHTNSAWGIISRLIDMNIPEYLISATLNIAAAQRLLRLLCPNCKEESSRDLSVIKDYTDKEIENHLVAKGCEQCNYSGYKGRRAIFEIIEINQALKDMIKNEKFDNLKYQNFTKGSTLKEQAIELFEKGETSFEEILPIMLDV